jgi:hypothetical protein
LNRLYPWRWWLLAVYLLALAPALWWLVIHSAMGSGSGLDGTELIFTAAEMGHGLPGVLARHVGYAIFLGGLLWIFFQPRRWWGRPLIPREHWERFTLAPVAAAGLTTALVACLATVGDWTGIWQPLVWPDIQSPSNPSVAAGKACNPWPVYVVRMVTWYVLMFMLALKGAGRHPYVFRAQIVQTGLAVSAVALVASGPTFLVLDAAEGRPLGISFLGSRFACVFSISTLLWFGAAWLLLVFGWNRHIQSRSGTHCPSCDYDLRGTSGSGCPECGFVLSNSKSA